MAYDCIIIGGGAAGLMCAATAGYREKNTLIIDHANKIGKKILMSGGGRCNFTNLFVEPDNYLSNNPHFCKSALSRYSQYDFIDLVERYQLAYHDKGQGQLFCDNKAKDILNILLSECEQAAVAIQTDCEIFEIVDHKRESNKPEFTIKTNQGKLTCNALVIATGGLSIPTMGASGFGYNIAKQFGIKTTIRQPSLVPYIFKGTALEICQSLAGVSLDVSVCCNGQSFNEPLLFTHRGISGPAILQISNYWNPDDIISLDFAPNLALAETMTDWKKQGNKSELKNLLSQHLPKRFVQAWLAQCEQEHGVGNKPVNQYNDKDITIIDQFFKQWEISPPGTEGYRTAEVTRGGINTDEVSSKTFESKKTPGLYFIGEVLDVTGWLGGFNFQWAWASGYCAGNHV